MVSFNKFFTSVLLAVVYASSVAAAPSPGSIKHSTHRTRALADDVKLETYNPPSTFETFENGIDHPLAKRQTFKLEDASKAFAASRLGVDTSKITYKSGFSGQSAKYSFLKQAHEGIPFANAVANVAFNLDNKVVAYGSSFVKPRRIASPKPSVDVSQAIATAESALNAKYTDFPTTLEYFVKPDNSVVLTHVIQVRNDAEDVWVEAFVDAHTNELVSIVDFVAEATYRVLPVDKQDVTHGFETLTDPDDSVASPLGWHSTGSTTTTDTSGNNVIAYRSSQSTGTTKQTSATHNFIYNHDASVVPTTQENINAATTNAFYVVNAIHDFTYRYGFTEAAYNFQANNNGKGGKANDRVLVSVQDSGGKNNANFATPADGSSGQMRMYLWDRTTPGRDGSLENDIITHEMTHGITNRLTGGGTGRCLQTTEAGGMGEGWSDTLANWAEKRSSDVPDFVVGNYVTNNPAGIRQYPYSTSATTNPLKYSNLKTLSAVHAIGTVWANVLHNVYAELVAQYGWSPTARTNPDGAEGNIVFLHLFIDSLSIQPCNPTFLSARSAWIQADVNRYGGANKCLLWRVFASKGLGVNAANHNDDATLPAGC